MFCLRWSRIDREVGDPRGTYLPVRWMEILDRPEPFPSRTRRSRDYHLSRSSVSKIVSRTSFVRVSTCNPRTDRVFKETSLHCPQFDHNVGLSTVEGTSKGIPVLRGHVPKY